MCRVSALALNPNQCEAFSEAVSTDADLTRIIAAWPRLAATMKNVIRAIIDSATR
jgi:hypothetical protein